MKAVASYLVLIFCCCASFLHAQEIKTQILQVKIDRFYFDCGAESGAAKDAEFVILCPGAPVVEGTLEFVGPGISYSYPISGIDTLKINPACSAVITAGTIDTMAVIMLGTDLPMEFFDPEHEPLFQRTDEGVAPRLVDSIRFDSTRVVFHLPPNIWFSDGTRLDAETVVWWLKDIWNRRRTALVRYFYAKMLPPDSGGIELIDAFTFAVRFYFPFPTVDYFLSHPDFAIYSRGGRGTGSLTELIEKESGPAHKVLVPNWHYRGDRPRFRKIIIKNFEQSFRMTFAFEQEDIDGYIGFGLDETQAGQNRIKTLYPQTAVLIAGIGGALFSQGRFPASIYYRIDPKRSHLYFPNGSVQEVNRWLIPSSSPTGGERYYPCDPVKGSALFASIGKDSAATVMTCGNRLLEETAKYIADLAARDGVATTIEQSPYATGFDLSIRFLPASNELMPFSLFAAVLELNDQNGLLEASRRYKHPGWDDADRGTRFDDTATQRRFFLRAEETLFETGGFFPLFRPVVTAVTNDMIKDIRFDPYGYPVLERIVKYGHTTTPESSRRKK